ncbi:MAG: tRNA lysidine(34) synthetase TilS [Actinomycetota bacterium]|jgi:tRNA(Ile)-lysidine synthase
MPSLVDSARGLPLIADLLSRCSFPPEHTYVDCAVSGGADSVALLVLARAANLNVTAWHVDHGLRENSHTEAELVAQLATQLGAQFETRTIIVEQGANTEARAREARYGAMPQGVMTGHTADDQAETILINLLRGSGTRGLAGMQPTSQRPLLHIRRSETRALCSALGISVFNDPSNNDERFQRNRIRHEVLPLLESLAKRDLVPVLTRQADLLRDDDDLLNELASALDPTDALALAVAPVALSRRAIRSWLTNPLVPDSATVERVLEVARGNTLACDIGLGRQVRRSQQRLRITEVETSK